MKLFIMMSLTLTSSLAFSAGTTTASCTSLTVSACQEQCKSVSGTYNSNDPISGSPSGSCTYNSNYGTFLKTKPKQKFRIN